MSNKINLVNKISFFIFLISALLLSCRKEDEDIQSFTISNSDTLRYSLGFFGDEEGASIQEQATHYSLSRIGDGSNTPEWIYIYVASSSFVGTDYVEINSARGSDGMGKKNRDITISKITIHVE